MKAFAAFAEKRRRPRFFAAGVLVLLLMAVGLWGFLRTRQTSSLLAWGTPAERASLARLLGEFERRHWRVNIALETSGDAESAAAILMERAKEGRAPDAALVRAEDLDALLAADALQPVVVDEGEAVGQITALRSAFERNGKTWGVPFGWSVLMLYYDRGLFEARGIPIPRDFWDWGDLLAAAQALTQHDAEGKRARRYGLALEGAAGEIAAFLWQNRGQIADETGRWTFTDPRYVQSNAEALRFYASLVGVHRVAPPPDSRGALALFASKKTAMAIGPRHWASDLDGAPGLDWDIAPLPKGREPATCLEVYGCGVPRGARHAGTGTRLATFLARETSQAVLAAHGGMAPARVSLLGSRVFLDFPPRRPARNDALARSLPFARTLSFGPHSREAAALLADEARALMTNPSASVRVALERLQTKLEAH